MDNKIDQIKALLDEISHELRPTEAIDFIRNFDALEVPELIAAIVDYLQPILTPIEVSVYWYLFRHSILASGSQYTCAGTKSMTNIASSSRKSTDQLDFKSVRTAILGLIEKGVIAVTGETTNVGTPYRILLPEEIPLCRERMATVEERNKPVIDAAGMVDYYNVRENRIKVFERDGYSCHYCNKLLTRFTATLDHIQPVSEGGDNSYDNLVTACLHCNSHRGSRPVMDAIIRGKTLEQAS